MDEMYINNFMDDVFNKKLTIMDGEPEHQYYVKNITRTMLKDLVSNENLKCYGILITTRHEPIFEVQLVLSETNELGYLDAQGFFKKIKTHNRITIGVDCELNDTYVQLVINGLEMKYNVYPSY